MFPRITNASDINKPIIKVLDQNQADQMNQIYENEEKSTFKKRVVLVISILIITFITIWTLYYGLFVLDFGDVPAKCISVNDVSISQDDILTLQLASNSYSLGDNLEVNTLGDVKDVLYITVKQPMIAEKISYKEERTKLMERKYEIYVNDISAVFYMGKNEKDIFLIWKR
jgi:hypothetical protein